MSMNIEILAIVYLIVKQDERDIDESFYGILLVI